MTLTHEPEGYDCPLCRVVKGIDEGAKTKQGDIVYKDEYVTAFISAFSTGKNPGHVTIVPNQHFENIYNLPTDLGAAIFSASQKVSEALKEAFSCGGIVIRQNNEPTGDQHTFHYHLHVYPRYDNDGFNTSHPDDKVLIDEEVRKVQAEKLKSYLN